MNLPYMPEPTDAVLEAIAAEQAREQELQQLLANAPDAEYDPIVLVSDGGQW
jgi:hypothetical protein